MSCNCYFLGCLNACDDVNTGQQYASTEKFVIELHGPLMDIEIEVDGVTGEDIIVPVENLNEENQYKLKLRKVSDGSYVSWTIASVEYDCMTFQLKTVKDFTPADDTPLADDCPNLTP